MALIVQKFGGTSVGDLDRIRNVALRAKAEVDQGHQVAVIVSAMAGTTNQLVEWAREIGPMHDAREYDTIVAAGEQVAVGLLSIALQNIGIDARSGRSARRSPAWMRLADTLSRRVIPCWRPQTPMPPPSGHGPHGASGFSQPSNWWMMTPEDARSPS